MNTRSEERLLKNYHNARKTWEAWCFMNNIDLEPSRPEVRETVNESGFLSYLSFILFKDLHIELHKILKDKKTSADNIFYHLRGQDNEDSNLMLERLSKYSVSIEEILKARDKLFAHLDPDYKKINLIIPIETIYQLFELIEESLIVLGLEQSLLTVLKSIPSRDDFNLI